MSKQLEGDEAHLWLPPVMPRPVVPGGKKVEEQPSSIVEPVTPSEVVGWYVYDLANSPFYQVVDPMIVVMMKRMAELSAERGRFPDQILSAGSYPSVVTWATAALQTVCLLSFAPYGDYGSRRLQLLRILTFMGSALTMINIFCFTADMWSVAGLLRVLAGSCHLLSSTYYTAYLPLIASAHWALDGLVGKERMKREAELNDELSAKGWLLGYGGGISMQIISFVILFLTESSEGSDFRRLFPLCTIIAMVGVWWSVFAIYSFRKLKTRPGKPFPDGSTCCLGWKQTAETACTVLHHRDALLFLISYFLWSDALNTTLGVGVLLLASGNSRDSRVIFNSILATAGGILGLGIFLKVQQLLGMTNKQMLMVHLTASGVLSMAAGFGLVTALDGVGFYMVMAPMMLMIGSLQANARSLCSSLAPAGKEAAMFSFYTITDKGSTLIGAVVVAVVHTVTGEYVHAFWYTAFAFVVSTVILFFVDIERGMRQAGQRSGNAAMETGRTDSTTDSTSASGQLGGSCKTVRTNL